MGSDRDRLAIPLSGAGYVARTFKDVRALITAPPSITSISLLRATDSQRAQKRSPSASSGTTAPTFTDAPSRCGDGLQTRTDTCARPVAHGDRGIAGRRRQPTRTIEALEGARRVFGDRITYHENN
jgi:hypothetical protein